MGFWQTGYMEFHEPDSNEPLFTYSPPPPRFSCVHCDETFASTEVLQEHRFVAHPLHRPVMFLQGRELGTHPKRITRPLSSAEVRVEGCDRATLNGREITVSDLPEALAGITSDVCRVILSKSGVEAAFELNIRVATKRDLEGVEDQFKRMVQGHRLDTRAVEEFISTASPFRSAIGYCDGVCAYLYGVLAKERAPGSSLPYEAYGDRFSKAADELVAYERPLARMIGSLVEFHFNHFRDSAILSPDTRVGRVADRYASWIKSRRHISLPVEEAGKTANHLEALVTDSETEQIVCWGSRPLSELRKDANVIESFTNHRLAEYDRVKLHVLLAELYAEFGDTGPALKHARALRNVATFEGWAEELIRVLSEDQDGHA